MALVAVACSDDGGSSSGSAAPTTSQPVAEAATHPTAPEAERVDLEPPTFSDPTVVDNPLFPISDLHSAILIGNEGGHPLEIETTLLPGHETVEVDGESVETLLSQFVAFLDGRIEEVAIDRYAQADDGSVWYFGEDVYNYEDGVVADTEGTWLAGEDGPAAMIMPADPQVGDVYRSENIPGSIFEEVTVESVGQTVDGPRGPVEGAMVGQENHVLEGTLEDKTFAPGYGEFRSGAGGNLEALAVAVPTDALGGPVPAELAALVDGADAVFEAAGTDDWGAAEEGLTSLQRAWSTLQAQADVPPLLATAMGRALSALAGDEMVPAVHAHNAEGAQQAAIDVGQAALDLELQYRDPAEVDRERFVRWARQLVVDATSVEPEPGNVAGDVTSLEWVWDRIAHTYDEAPAGDIEAQLDALRVAADDEDVAAAAAAGPHLVDTLDSLA